jgi:hypothetical protein
MTEATMADDNPTRFLALKPENLEIAATKDRNVAVRLVGLEKEAGLSPGLGVMLVLTPTEARRFAEGLRNTANKAEVGLPRA